MEFIHYGHNKFIPDNFRKIENLPERTKPKGGFWASPVNAQFGWIDWCIENEIMDDIFCNMNEYFNFKLKESSKIQVINCPSDLYMLPQAYTPKYKRELGLVFLDFEKMLEGGVDAILLNLSNNHDLYWRLFEWDCDSLLLLNKNAIEEVII